LILKKLFWLGLDMLLVWGEKKIKVLNNNIKKNLNSNLGVGWAGVRQVVLTFKTCLKYENFNLKRKKNSKLTHVIDKVVT
jgi:hypothetical protein